jgi:hypothetical protein
VSAVLHLRIVEVAARTATRDVARVEARRWLYVAWTRMLRALREPALATRVAPPVPGATLPLGGASTDPSSRSASASASASAWAASASARAASASASAPSALVDPGAPRADAPSPSGEPSASAPAGRGACRLELPPSSAGRRVFVDGRVVGEGPGALVVPCGARTVQIGSKGTPRAMVLPCGGTARAE